VIEKSIPNLLIQRSRMKFYRYDDPNDIELFSMHQIVALYEVAIEGIYFVGSHSTSLG
jgi:hypothetical protein